MEASIKYGLNNSSVITKDVFDNIDHIKGPKTGHYVEGMIDYSIDNNWSIGGGLAYKEKGFSITQKTNVSVLGLDLPVGIKAELNVNAIEIPARIKYNISNPFVNAYVLAGGGYAIHTNSIVKTSANFIGDISVAEFGTDNLVNRNEFYGTLGIGLQKGMGHGRLFTEIIYNQSFENYTSELIVDIPVKNRGFTVGVGYSMPLN